MELRLWSDEAPKPAGDLASLLFSSGKGKNKFSEGIGSVRQLDTAGVCVYSAGVESSSHFCWRGPDLECSLGWGPAGLPGEVLGGLPGGDVRAGPHSKECCRWAQRRCSGWRRWGREVIPVPGWPQCPGHSEVHGAFTVPLVIKFLDLGLQVPQFALQVVTARLLVQEARVLGG